MISMAILSMGIMRILDKILKVWYCVFGLMVGIILFYVGRERVLSGIYSVRIFDSYTAHYMSVGLMYIQISLLIIIALTIVITYSLTRKK